MVIFSFKILLGLILLYFLPGYFFLKIAARGLKLKHLEYFTFSLVISPAILIAPICLLTSFFGLSFKSVLSLAIVEVIALFMLGFIKTRGLEGFNLPRIDIRRLDWLFIAGLALTVSLSLYVQFSSTRMQVSHHGTNHGNVVYQIINGIIPPTNPCLYGEPISTYWMYHLKLALFSNILRISPPQASVLNNIYSLVAFLLVLYCISRIVVIHTPCLKSILPFFTLGVSNILGPLRFIGKLVFNKNAAISVNDLKPISFVANILRHTKYLDIRLDGLFYKFLSFQGNTDGLLYVAALILFAILFLKKADMPYIVLLFISLIGAIMFHPTSSIAAVLCFLSLGFCIYFTKSFGGSNRKDIFFKLILGILLTSAVTGIYIYSASSSLATRPIVLARGFFNINMILSYYWIALPFYICGLILMLKKWNITFMFICLCSVAIFLAATFLQGEY